MRIRHILVIIFIISLITGIIVEPVAAADLRVGMTKKEVQTVLGNPCVMCSGTRQTNNGEVLEFNRFMAGNGVDRGTNSNTHVFFDNNGIVTGWIHITR